MCPLVIGFFETMFTTPFFKTGNSRVIDSYHEHSIKTIFFQYSLAQHFMHQFTFDGLKLHLKNQMEILHTIRHIVKKNSLTAIITIHRLNLAFRFADKIILLNKGQDVARGTTESIDPGILSKVYGIKTEIIRQKRNLVVIPV